MGSSKVVIYLKKIDLILELNQFGGYCYGKEFIALSLKLNDQSEAHT